ncbi:peroxiredoxin [Sphingomonas sp. AOB5]|uniref:peroxiredoxin n=1 Tax=Sphingomonas sp. AOB5 TaxID=3034017 RepID=UPI0023F93EE7|nr:peroxiredoxin [Sphingomonas sp. AOB5]MDF7775465.1 peroxiredoxin [Sphingomonas sp. AOB5]
MRGLTILVATADAERFRMALTLAAANAALGGRTRVYLHEAAVALLGTDEPLIATAMETGATLIACQTGLAIAEMDASALPEGVETGGLVGILADLGDDQLTTV